MGFLMVDNGLVIERGEGAASKGQKRGFTMKKSVAKKRQSQRNARSQEKRFDFEGTRKVAFLRS